MNVSFNHMHVTEREVITQYLPALTAFIFLHTRGISVPLAVLMTAYRGDITVPYMRT